MISHTKKDTPLSEQAVVKALAEHISQSITCKTITFLQRMKENALQSGDDSGLENIWDEICVQVQYEQSALWELYEETVKGRLEYHVDRLLPHECEAIWLQTPQGFDWQYEDESDRKQCPVYHDDIIEYLLKDYVCAAAQHWSNQRIRDYLERSCW